MRIAPTSMINLIIRPNGIDAAWEVIDGYDLEPMGFYDTFQAAYTDAVETAKRSAYLVGMSCGAGMPVAIIADYKFTTQGAYDGALL